MKPDLDLSPEEAVRLAGEAGFEFDVSDQDLRYVTPLALEALSVHNEPPEIFRHADQVSRLEKDKEGGFILRPMTLDRMTHALARAATWYRWGPKGLKRAVAPPAVIVKDVLATPNPRFPLLVLVVRCPVFGRSGELNQEAGYQPSTFSYYVPKPGFTLPAIPTKPSSNEIATARRLVLEVIEEFPFVGESERAHALALGLLPFLRDVVDGPTPLHVIEKPSPGTGGTLLVDALTYPSTGEWTTAITEAKDDDEWRKRITSLLRGSPTVGFIDNVSRPVSSAALAAVLTSITWEDRILGKSETIRLPNRAVWVLTGNNPTLSHEIARRSIRIRLDANTQEPWLRDHFQKKDLRGWVEGHRAEIVSAYLTLCQAWVVAGRPRNTATRLGSFESWSEVMGGLLQYIEVPGFLGNLNDFYSHTDSEDTSWLEFLNVWWASFQDRAVGVSDLYRIGRVHASALDLGLGNENSQRTRLGKLLASVRDRQFEHLRLTTAGKKQGAQLWKLSKVA